MTLLAELQALKAAYKGNAEVTGAINDTIAIIEKHFAAALSKWKPKTTHVSALPRP